MHRQNRTGPATTGPERSRVPTPDTIGTIRVVELAHSFRIDSVSIFPDGSEHRHKPEHYPSRELAEQFAQMLARNTGFEIIEGDGQ